MNKVEAQSIVVEKVQKAGFAGKIFENFHHACNPHFFLDLESKGKEKPLECYQDALDWLKELDLLVI